MQVFFRISKGQNSDIWSVSGMSPKTPSCFIVSAIVRLTLVRSTKSVIVKNSLWSLASTLDCAAVQNRKRARSRYGAKRPKTK